MSEAANISLNAIGMQDTHLLSKNSKDSLFNPSHKHNSEFRKYHRTHTVDNLQKNEWWPFGHTVKVEFNPRNMGDLLTNIWVKIALPEWSVSEAGDWAYGKFVGRRLIKNIRMRVDGLILQEIDTEMMVIFDQLYKSYDQKLALNAQFNLNRYHTNRHPIEIDLDAQKNVFIHIPFFFTQNYGGDAYDENKQNKPPFPVCSIHKQKIQFEIEFHKPSYFVYTNLTNNRILPPKMIDNFQIVTEEVTLSNEERLYYKTKPIEITTEFTKKHSSRDINVIDDKTFSIILEPTIPVKMFHWFFRPKFFETEGNYDKLLVENRMFFKTAVPKEGPDPQPLDFINTLTVLDRAYFTLDGDRFPRATKMDVEYFKRIIPYTTKLSESGLSPTLQGYYALQNTSLTNSGGLQRTLIKDLKLNDIFSYNFAVYPKSTQPSGFLDFSQLNSDKTQLHIEIDQRTIQNRQRGHESMDDLTMYLYYTGYNVLRFEDGNVSFNG